MYDEDVTRNLFWNIEKLQSENKNLNIWRWQNYTFEEDILHSMKIAKKGLDKLREKYQIDYKNFEERGDHFIKLAMSSND